MHRLHRLVMPHRGRDDDEYRNIRTLEAWANGSRDALMLRDWDELPPADEWPKNTIIQVEGVLYRHDGEWWDEMFPEDQNSPTLTWSFQGDLAAATEYEDLHYLPIPFGCIIEKMKVRSSQAPGGTDTLDVMMRQEGVNKKTLQLYGSKVRASDTMRMRADEDDEVNFALESSVALTDVQVTVVLTLRRV